MKTPIVSAAKARRNVAILDMIMILLVKSACGAETSEVTLTARIGEVVHDSS
jgi:hypothetical protein